MLKNYGHFVKDLTIFNIIQTFYFVQFHCSWSQSNWLILTVVFFAIFVKNVDIPKV